MHQGSRRAFPAPALVLAASASRHAVAVCHYRNPHDLQRGGIENAAQSRAPDVSRVRRSTPGFIPIQQTAGECRGVGTDVTWSPQVLDRNKRERLSFHQPGRSPSSARPRPTQLRRFEPRAQRPMERGPACLSACARCSIRSPSSDGSRHVPAVPFPFRAPAAHPPGQCPGHRLPAGPARPGRRRGQRRCLHQGSGYRGGHRLGQPAMDQGCAGQHQRDQPRGHRAPAGARPGHPAQPRAGRDRWPQCGRRAVQDQAARHAVQLHAGAGGRQAHGQLGLDQLPPRPRPPGSELDLARPDRAHRSGARTDVVAVRLRRHGRRDQHHHPAHRR
ncbi:Uncharacterised protein [Stenotrophomonas maltophilia]|nr:Uncharacterised protein [Stenotrophomonas maltophilia]